MDLTFLGEKFFCKLLDTFTEMGVGLTKTWQIRRVGKARTKVRVNEIRQLAAAQKDADDIRAGVKIIDQQGNVVPGPYLPPPDQSSSKTPAQPPTDPSLSSADTNRLLTDALVRFRYRELKREINLRAIAHLAQDENVPDEEVADKKVSDQWASRWIEGAQDVSDEELRILWAKLLAGEVKRPGAYSLRTVEYLRRISPGEAKRIEQIAGLAFRSSIRKQPAFIYANKDTLQRIGISISLLLELEDVGILNTAALKGFAKTFKDYGDSESIRQYLFFQNKMLILESYTPGHALQFPVYRFTNVGAEIVSLGKFVMNREYLSNFTEYLNDNDIRVFQANIGKATDKNIGRRRELKP